METPRIDGYVVDRLVGFGSTGRVWRAQVAASGEWVALKWLRPEAIAVLERLQRDAAAVTAASSQHLVRVRSVIQVGAEVFVVSDFVSGDSLETLLARRDRLSAPEVVTLLGPVAAAIAELHAVGLVHGALTPSNLLIAPDGRPMLTDCGIALALGGRSAEPAEDVRALAELGLAALDDALTPLAAMFTSVLEGAPERGPSARELATAVLESGSAAPIRVASPRRPPDPASLITDRPMPSPRRTTTEPGRQVRRLPVGRPPVAEPEVRDRFPGRRRVLLGVVIAVAVSVSVVGLVKPRKTPTATPRLDGAGGVVEARPTDWSSIVQRLETDRAQAFTRPDPSLLAEVYLPTSPDLARDRRTIAGLENRGLRSAGFTATVVDIRAVRVTTATASLEVSDRLSAYSLVDSNGGVIGRGAARPSRTYLMTLVRTAVGWRVQNIEASAASSSG